MKLLVLKNAEAIAETGARLAADILRDRIARSGSAVLGLAGGRSLAGIYRALAEYQIPAWKNTHFFWVDERRVALTDPQSNYRLAEELLLRPLLKRGLIATENIHPVQSSDTPELVTQNYTLKLNRFGGYFDLVLLGAGEDGHIAAVFPEYAYSEIREFTYLDNAPKAPPQRFTASPALLAASRCGIVVYSGESKRKALLHFLEKSADKTLPERTLREMKSLIILTDQKV
ncbi:MAG: 6-phosphogluconolactonase [Candidatus Neomarinimicrobiota bacterium]|jgi:6-phosphogluconolactonase|nr:6-phosphogluconolactonase [Candidatus Neomarinimicrobiota bacterium]MDD3966341.1 6-phosphogluconolactonase [Candidatus Neomarinimicrobiota bacterium]MDX9780090.1 6-phosphogluconolactonase [bacterium]